MILRVCSFILLGLVRFSCAKSMFDNTFVGLPKKLSFVDKTPLIYEFLQHKYLFVNAPSKFGKSTNLDMISLFLSNCSSKEDIRNSFKGTKILENEEFVANNMGQYPLINFKMKFRGYSHDFENTITEFKVSLYNAFIDHMYLFDSERLDDDQKKRMEVYTDLTRIRLMDTDTMTRGLGFLAQVLHQHHVKPVILLVDEFGRGITEGILQNQLDLTSLVELYSAILNNTFSDQNLISHALFTGESWIHGLKGPIISSLEHVPFMQRVEFSQFYGFSYDEVDQLIAKFNISKDKISEVHKWYGGYSTRDGLFKVCNPYSVIEYLSHHSKLVYWSGSALIPDLIRRMVELDSPKKLVIDLVMRKTVSMNVTDNKIVEVEYLKQKVQELPENCGNFFLHVLLDAGYLTYDESKVDASPIPLKFPNDEVYSTVVKYTV